MSWPTVDLGNAVEILSGFAWKSAGFTDNQSGVPIIRIQNVAEKNSPADFVYWGDDYNEKYLIDEGDVLLSLSGNIKLGYWNSNRALLNQRIVKVTPLQIIDKGYLYYFLSGAVNDIAALGKKAVISNVSVTDLKKIKIPLPPLSVQKQIAAVLEKADTLRSQCQQMEQALNSLAQSVFLDMFGDPVSNSKNWPIKKFKDIGSSQLGKMLSEKSKQGVNPKRYLRNANVRWRKIELHDLLEMDFNEKEIKKFKLEHGDLLVCEGGDVGRCAIWRDELSDCYYQKALHRVRVNKDIVKPEYIQEYFYWMSKLGGLLSSVSEVTFSHLTAAKMAELKVPVPPIELQEGYIQKISVINESLKNIEESEAAYEQNFNSLMQRAFKGELDLKDVA